MKIKKKYEVTNNDEKGKKQKVAIGDEKIEYYTGK